MPSPSPFVASAVSVFLRRFAGGPHIVLESQSARATLGRWTLLAAGVRREIRVVEGQLQQSGEGGIRTFSLTRASLAEAMLAPTDDDEFTSRGTGLPVAGAWFGYLGYEAMTWLSEGPIPVAPGADDLPELWLIQPEVLLSVDGCSGRVFPLNAASEALATELRIALASETVPSACSFPRPRVASPPMPAQYAAAIGQLREYILAGDIFQANFTWRFASDSIGPIAGRLHAALRAINPASHAALLEDGRGLSILSSSPELYLRQRADGLLETRPIKGTRPLEPGMLGQRLALVELLHSHKDAAEHVMIVDVERNDLGRVAERGGVCVERLMRPLPLAGLLHMESSIVATPLPGLSPLDAVAALFPGGSISGAPKIRACQIIRELEPRRRNVYTGCIGWIGAQPGSSGGGCAVHLNIAIRSLYRASHDLPWTWHGGGGIVADSTAEHEWAETLTKTQRLRMALAAAQSAA